MKYLLNLFFPKICFACKEFLMDNELYVCTICRHALPVTNFHFNEHNILESKFYGRFQYKAVTGLLYFHKKSGVQELIHGLKYKGYEDVGLFLGQWLGAELSTIPLYQTVDAVVPVPLHIRRERKRGFNQVDKFAQEIAKSLDAEFDRTSLKKVKATQTQVFKDKVKRSISDEAIFTVVDYESLKNKHVLLVDDVITTGATIEICANALLKIEGLTLSVAAMAITH